MTRLPKKDVGKVVNWPSEAYLAIKSATGFTEQNAPERSFKQEISSRNASVCFYPQFYMELCCKIADKNKLMRFC